MDFNNLVDKVDKYEKRETAHKSKSRRYVVGDIALWASDRLPTILTGKLNFGTYENKVTYNVRLFQIDPDTKYSSNNDERLSGIVTVPKPRGSKDKEQQIGKIRLYQTKDDVNYVMIWIGGFTEDDRFDFDTADTYTSTLEDTESDNPRAPLVKGKVTPEKNKNEVEESKAKAKSIRPPAAKINKSNAFFNPEDMIEILRAYDKEQLNQIFWALAELEGLPDVVVEALTILKNHRENKAEPQEDYFEYVDEVDNEDDGEEDDIEAEENVEVTDYEEETEEEEDCSENNEDLPQIRLGKIKRRIADIANENLVDSVTKRSGSGIIEGVHDSHLAEDIL